MKDVVLGRAWMTKYVEPSRCVIHVLPKDDEVRVFEVSRPEIETGTPGSVIWRPDPPKRRPKRGKP